MPKIFEIATKGRTFVFDCNSRSTRHGFAHDCSMRFVGSNPYRRDVVTAHRYYLNRTWEAWTFQSACLDAANNAMAIYIAHKRRMFMISKGYKRMSAKRELELLDSLKYEQLFADLLDCKAKLQANQY